LVTGGVYWLLFPAAQLISARLKQGMMMKKLLVAANYFLCRIVILGRPKISGFFKSVVEFGKTHNKDRCNILPKHTFLIRLCAVF